jgi:hypothetical protein
MSATWLKRGGAAAVLLAAMLSSGCGEFVRQSQSPSQLVIVSILTARGTGTVATTFVNGPLLSDVPAPGETTFNDFGQATLRVILRDPGTAAIPTAASDINDVTITGYRVVYRRSDGRNTPGVDVPRAFDGAVTFTVRPGATGVGVIELVRHVAKLEAPLAILGTSTVVLTIVADVTFFGRDQAGNELSATGNVQVNFANFN